MRQVLPFHGDNSVASNPTYANPFMGAPEDSAEDGVLCPWAVTGRLTYLRIELGGAPGAGTGWTFTLRVEEADTAVAITISDTDTSGVWTGSLAITAGQLVSMRYDRTGSPSGSSAPKYMTLEFDSTDDTESGYAYSVGVTSVTQYFGAFGAGATNSVVGAGDDIANVSPLDGNFVEFFVRMEAAASATTITLTLYKNGVAQDGSGGTPNATIVLAAGTGAALEASLAVTVPIATGDRFYVQATRTSGASRGINWSARVQADTAGQSIMAGYFQSISTVSRWAPFRTGEASTGWMTTAPPTAGAFAVAGASPFRLSRMHLKFFTAPGAGDSRTFSLYTGGASTALAVTISETDLTGTDLADGVEIAAGGLITIAHTFSGTPAGSTALLSMVQTDPSASEIEFAEGGNVDIGLTWVEVTDKLEVMRVHTKVGLSDPPTYYGGYKDDRVTQWGRITRALSDWRGQYESAYFTWTQADTDRTYRALLDAVATRALKNRPATVRMIDDPSRRLQLTPRTMMKGIIREYEPLSPLLFRVTLRDVLASKFGSENTKDQIPVRLVSRTDFPDCPLDAIGQPVPIIYGDMTGGSLSATAAPLLTGTTSYGAWLLDPDSNPFGGVCEWRWGYGPLTSSAAVPTGVLVATAASGTISADAPSDAGYGILVTSVDADGNETDPHVFYYEAKNSGRGNFSGTPIDPSYLEFPDGTQKITVSWTAASGASKYRVYMLTYYYGARDGQWIEVTSPTVSTEFTAAPEWSVQNTPDNITPGASVVQYGAQRFYAVTAIMADGETAKSALGYGASRPYRRPIRVEWQAVTGATAYKVYGKSDPAGAWERVWDVPSSQTYFDDDMLDTGVTYITDDASVAGKVPVIPVGTRVATPGSTWYAFLVCGHALTEITALYQNNALVSPATFGSTWLVPGYTGYDTHFPATGDPEYLDINGNRYTLIFGAGPHAEDAASGAKPLTVDVRGIETVGDSSGTLIEDAMDIYLHVVQNWVLQSYTSGAWLSTPAFEDDAGLLQVDEESFTTASAVAAARITGGYTGAFVLGANGERLTIRDLIARLNVSFDVDSGFNRKTQFFVRMVDDSIAALNAAIPTGDVRDIFANSFELRVLNDEHYNDIPYAYDRDYVGVYESGWVTEGSVSDADSIAEWDETKTSSTVELHCVRDTGMATDVVYRRLMRQKDPPLLIRWEQGMSGLSIELGDIVDLTHYGGLGASGFTWRPVRVVRHETDPEQYIVAIEAIDADRLFGGAFILGDETTLAADWASASVADRRYGYLGDETTGVFSDDAPMKRLR